VIDYTTLQKDHSKIKVVKTFDHPCEVNKARAMKQDWRIIASLSNSGEVLLFNFEKEGYHTLKGLEEEGFGLSWNPLQKGLLAGATGKTICLWDTDGSSD
jgi:histone-binding protein RBBP4